MAKKIAYAIARESSGDKTLANQFADIRKAAKDLKYEIVKEFGENISGNIAKYDYANPKFIEDLQIAIKQKKPDAIFCVSMDRVTRTPVMQGKYLLDFSIFPQIPIYFTRYKRWTIDPITKIVDKDWIDDLSSDKSSKTERLNIVARTTPQREKNGIEGYYIGHLSDGYCVKEEWGTYEDGRRRKIKTIIPDEKRRGVIERIYKLYLKGNSTDKIASILNAENVPTANRYRSENLDKFGYKQKYVGKDKMERERSHAKWSGTIIAQVLSNEWYKGVRTYKETKLYHEPLVSVEDWEAVKIMRDERKVTFRNKKEAPKHMFLLSDLFFCGKCGRKMYGHFTGLNNHYYCSSVESATKCGLEGISKENIEGILYEVISNYGMSSILLDEPNNIITDYFKLNKEKEQEYKEAIAYNDKIISKIESDNKQLDESIDFYIQQQGLYKDNPSLEKRYAAQITTNLAKIKDNNEKIVKLQVENKNYRQKLNSSSSIKQILDRIVEAKELSEIRELFKQAIDNVVIFNAHKRTDVIRIRYKNDKEDEIIYSSGLLKGKYIQLHAPLYYDQEQNLLTSRILPIYIVTDNDNYVFIRENDSTLKDEQRLLPDLEILKSDVIKIEKGITVKDFINVVRNASNMVSEYNRLEEEPEIAKTQRERHKILRKKYNTGLPTSEPYVLRNETYKEICEKRKHLYNRRYKIKRNKSMSLEEKERQLEDIKRQLDILTIQVPTFKPRKKRSDKTDDKDWKLVTKRND